MLLLAGFLKVLKIIGIVLLIILAVLLVLLLLVLFAPVVYKVDASSPRMNLDEFDAEKVSARARFSWLWFVIRGGIEFPEDKQFTLRVFGIKILPKKEKPDKTGKDKKEEGKAEETGTEESKAEEAKTEETAASQEVNTEESEAEEIKPQEEPEVEADSSFAEEEEKEPKTFLDVLWNIFDTIDNILKTPLNVFEKIRYTISRVCGKISMIKTTLESEIFDRAFTLVKKKLIKILKMIWPDKIKADIVFGSGDPATTAEIMGAYGALYPKLYKKVRYTPDFEEKVLEGEIHLKGHITVFTLVYSAAVCYFNRDVKKVIKRFKKIINS